MSQSNLIIGGDLNCVLDQYLDRSSFQRIITSKSSELLHIYINNTNIKDVWRIANPSGREYSFYSGVHKVYTRIAYFLLDPKLLPYTYNPKYHNIIISDHRPLTFSVKLEEMANRQLGWRYNPQILAEAGFCG